MHGAPLPSGGLYLGYGKVIWQPYFHVVAKIASFEKRVGGNGRTSPSSPSNAWWNGCRGAGPCQALAAAGGGRKARLYKGYASPATIATGGTMGCGSRRCPRVETAGGCRVTHSKFKRAKIKF